VEPVAQSCQGPREQQNDDVAEIGRALVAHGPQFDRSGSMTSRCLAQ
jgi:hypothetical protein